MRILIIDDEPAVSAILAEALRHEGNDVAVADHGEQGLAAILREPPDAVFLDIVMPGMDGIEVLRRIRERHPALPVIVLSGWASNDQAEAARRLGATDIVMKPDALKNLPDALARLRPI